MFLVIVRRQDANPDTGEIYVEPKWIIDADSNHLFTDEGGNYPVQEIKVAQIKAIECQPETPSSLSASNEKKEE